MYIKAEKAPSRSIKVDKHLEKLYEDGISTLQRRKHREQVTNCQHSSDNFFRTNYYA